MGRVTIEAVPVRLKDMWTRDMPTVKPTTGPVRVFPVKAIPLARLVRTRTRRIQPMAKAIQMEHGSHDLWNHVTRPVPKAIGVRMELSSHALRRNPVTSQMKRRNHARLRNPVIRHVPRAIRVRMEEGSHALRRNPVTRPVPKLIGVRIHHGLRESPVIRPVR